MWSEYTSFHHKINLSLELVTLILSLLLIFQECFWTVVKILGTKKINLSLELIVLILSLLLTCQECF